MYEQLTTLNLVKKRAKTWVVTFAVFCIVRLQVELRRKKKQIITVECTQRVGRTDEGDSKNDHKGVDNKRKERDRERERIADPHS